MSLGTPEDIVNAALDSIGYARHIGDIYEGSPAARVALEVYGTTRDALLASASWPFALREVALAAVAGQIAPTPWQNEYARPADCLRIRYIRPGPLTGGTRSLDPQPVLYQPWNDNRPNPAVQAILCDLNPAVLLYVGRVTDPTTWEPGFLAAFIADLAEVMRPMLAPSADGAKLGQAVAAEDRMEAESANDMSSPKAPSNGK